MFTTTNKQTTGNKQLFAVLKTLPFSLFSPHLSPSFSVLFLCPSLRNDKTRHITDACIFSDAMLQLTNQDPARAVLYCSVIQNAHACTTQIKKKQKNDYACMHATMPLCVTRNEKKVSQHTFNPSDMQTSWSSSGMLSLGQACQSLI